MQNITAIKKELRARAMRRRIDPISLIKENKNLLEKAKEYIRAHPPKIIGLFYPIASEPDISCLHDFCQINAIATAFPTVINDELFFKTIANLSELKKNNLGFLEPQHTNKTVFPDLIITPAIAYSTNGTRLGRGKGHYDKYLKWQKVQTLAIAYSWMRIDQIPSEPHDVAIRQIIWGDDY